MASYYLCEYKMPIYIGKGKKETIISDATQISMVSYMTLKLAASARQIVHTEIAAPVDNMPVFTTFFHSQGTKASGKCLSYHILQSSLQNLQQGENSCRFNITPLQHTP